MPVQTLTPSSLFQPAMYSQVAVATGTRTVFVAGQAPLDAHGQLVGEGDLAAQTEQVFRNVASALAAAEATFNDVGRLTIYLVGLGASTLEQLGAGFGRAGEAIGGSFSARPPVTLLVVNALAMPGQLIELEATAVLA
jgi:enamine deaminase RidA (YjgF/YER057c/UK114 family)